MNFLIIGLILLVFIITFILVWVNLPGTFIFLFFTFFLGLFTSFDIISKKILIIALLVCVFLELFEFLLSALTIKIYGGKNSSAFLSILGGFFGAFIGSFIFPIIGTLFGLIFVSFLITYYNEKRHGKTHQESMQIAGSVILGYIFSKGLKSLFIIVFACYIINLLYI